MGYVEHVLLANRAAVGHALHRTHYQWFSFFFFFFCFFLLSATLVNFRPFLRCEVILEDREIGYAAMQHIPTHNTYELLEGTEGGSTLSLAHMEAMMEDGGSPCSTIAISPWLSCSHHKSGLNPD